MLTTIYKNKTKNSELEYNEWQYNMLVRYEKLTYDIQEYVKSCENSRGFFNKFFPKKIEKPLGLYIYGSVGRGKTTLMDLFFENLPIKEKMRAHFNDFMQNTQSKINYYREEIIKGKSKNKDAVELVAEEIYEKAKILCFDEFSVTDIADAMILSRLFSKLFHKGLVLVATSNVEPNNLYMNGLNRQLFLPFIDLLKHNCELIDTTIDKDFRLDKQQNQDNYIYPINSDNQQKFIHIWNQLSQASEQKTIDCYGHKIKINKFYNKNVFFTFEELCARPLGINDYAKIAEEFNTIFIERVPIFNDENINWAKRFILLIDVLYEKNIKIFILAETHADQLYQGKAQRPEKLEFSRTASRLFEMQSDEYNKY